VSKIIAKTKKSKLKFINYKECNMASSQNLSSREERIKLLRKYLRRYGVPDEYIFEERDLAEFKNIPKVTRCFAMLAKMVSKKTNCSFMEKRCLNLFLGSHCLLSDLESGDP
jgi:hypothetical protein